MLLTTLPGYEYGSGNDALWDGYPTIWPQPQHTQDYPLTRRIGVAFLVPPLQEQLTPGVLNISLILDKNEQKMGFGGIVLEEVLKWAFDNLGLHRVQANVLDSPSKDHALKVFTKA